MSSCVVSERPVDDPSLVRRVRVARRAGLGALAALFALAAPLASAAPRDARAVYNAKCALCHGRDGRANPALAHAKVRHFSDADWQQERTDTQLAASIADGREGTLMRPFRAELSAEEIAALVKLIRTFAPPPAAPR
jgi:mono/diheme cytochrome c family protein